MTVYRPPRRTTFEFDFWYRGHRYRDNTKQTTKAEAEEVEANLKRRLRHQAGGIAIATRDDSPPIQEFAEIFIDYKSKRLERPEALTDILPVALQFWGRPADVEPSDAAPCHDLRLCDPIDDADWILKWERWLAARGLGNQSKNHYRGLMRRMYQVALLPEYRKSSGVQLNPFAGVPNDVTAPREVTLTAKQIRAWIAHASYHVRLAVGIGALAPKLRLANILALEWGEHFDPDPRTTKFNARIAHYITVKRHKTARKTRRPLVSPISAQLLRVLRDAWRRHPTLAHVVTYQGRPIKSIRGGVLAAVEAADLPYGRDRPDGVTFHTLRHSTTTIMSDQLADPMQLMDAAGHTDFATTLKYRHARPRAQKPALERLSRGMPIEDLVMQPRTRAARKKKR